jgi:hypothetical protein
VEQESERPSKKAARARVKTSLRRATRRRGLTGASCEPALHVLLGKTVEFLLGAGESPASVSRELQRQADRIDRRVSACRRKDMATVHEAYELFAKVCGVVHDWHRDSEYTDERAEPRQLTREELKGLIARRVRKGGVGTLTRWMFKQGIIRETKRGSVVLTGGRTVVLTKRGRRELALARASVVVPQYLRIALRNAQSVEPHSRDLDRDARVFSLPERYVPLWRAMARERAQLFLEGMDNWLEDHAAEDRIGPVREVAVHCYAYTGDVGRSTSSLRRAPRLEVSR